MSNFLSILQLNDIKQYIQWWTRWFLWSRLNHSNHSKPLDFSTNCTFIFFFLEELKNCFPALPNKLSHSIKAACSWLPTLVLFVQTRGLDTSECVREVKHLDQINIQQQLCLDFSKVITICSLFMWLFLSAKGKKKKKSVKDSTAYSHLNIIDINIILNH